MSLKSDFRFGKIYSLYILAAASLLPLSLVYFVNYNATFASTNSSEDIASRLLPPNSNASSVMLGGSISSVQEMPSPPDLILSGFWKLNLGQVTEDNNPIPAGQGVFSALFQGVLTNGSLPQGIRISDGILSNTTLISEEAASFNGTANFALMGGINIDDVPINVEINKNTFTLRSNQTDVSAAIGASPIYGIFTTAVGVR